MSSNYRKHIKYFCESCGITDKRLLCVHHIDRNHANNYIGNLKTLCYNCHRLTHFCDQKVTVQYLDDNMIKVEYPHSIKNNSFLNRLLFLLGYCKNNKILINKDKEIIGWICSKEDNEDILSFKGKKGTINEGLRTATEILRSMNQKKQRKNR